jgi:hypothetical protein
MRPWRALRWTVVAIAIAMGVSHICAVPFHAYAGALTPHEGHGSHHGDATGDDATHAASCEAVKTPAGASGVAVLAPVGAVASPAPPPRYRAERDGAVVWGSPPLFLLHAVLLI